MTQQEFIVSLEEKGIVLSEKQIKQFEKYYEILVEWNEKMNLTAITDREGVYNQTICDVGAGAGFPSVPLKIVYPELNVTIVDSLNKRITFLNHLFKELELDHIQAVASRAEDFCKDHRESFDIVMARAVARLNILDELCLPLVKKDGYFLSLKGLKAPEELKDAKGGIKVLGGEVMDDFTFTLSDQNDYRHNIVIKKVKSTPAKYPRNYGQIKKKPL